jgi:hypothetical protein
MLGSESRKFAKDVFGFVAGSAKSAIETLPLREASG